MLFLGRFSLKEKMLEYVGLEDELEGLGAPLAGLQPEGVQLLGVVEEDPGLEPFRPGNNVGPTEAYCLQPLEG